MTAGRLDLTAQGRFRYPLKTVAAAIYADSPDTSGGPNGAAQHWHVSPEAAEGGNIALIETGDKIVIDIPNRIALK